MSGFLSKLRVVLLGATNDLLDKAIDFNSPSALRQYVRDLEDALAKMKTEAAVQAGGIRTLEREHGDLQAKIDTATKMTKQYMGQNRSDMARLKAAEVVELQKQLQRNEEDTAGQKTVSGQLDGAVQKLELKHTGMVNRVHELERLDRTTKAKEASASALSSATKLVSTGAGISIDDIEGKMRARGDVASEKFDRAISEADTQEQEDSSTSEAVDDLLASLATKEEKTA